MKPLFGRLSCLCHHRARCLKKKRYSYLKEPEVCLYIIMNLLVNTVPNYLCCRVINILEYAIPPPPPPPLSEWRYLRNKKSYERAHSWPLGPPARSQVLEGPQTSCGQIFTGGELMFVNLSLKLHGHHCWWSSLVILLSSQCPSSEAVRCLLAES